jgi:hypothetical protein
MKRWKQMNSEQNFGENDNLTEIKSGQIFSGKLYVTDFGSLVFFHVIFLEQTEGEIINRLGGTD